MVKLNNVRTEKLASIDPDRVASVAKARGLDATVVWKKDINGSDTGAFMFDGKTTVNYV